LDNTASHTLINHTGVNKESNKADRSGKGDPLHHLVFPPKGLNKHREPTGDLRAIERLEIWHLAGLELAVVRKIRTREQRNPHMSL
jgi:hypothetical protein